MIKNQMFGEEMMKKISPFFGREQAKGKLVRNSS